MDADALRVCIGCDLGSNAPSLTDLVAIFAAATGVISFAIAAQAYRWSTRQHDALLLREEFATHRAALDAQLRQIDRILVVLRQSHSTALPIARLQTNFLSQQTLARLALGELADELGGLDARELFGFEFLPDVAANLHDVEQAWDDLSDPATPEPGLRAAATVVVANMEACCAKSRLNIEKAIKVALSRGRWRKK